MTHARALTLLALVLATLLSAGAPTARAAVPGNPFTAAPWFVDSNSPAWRQVRAWSDSRPADARQIEKIARQPKARWFGDWDDDVALRVDSYVSKLQEGGFLPVMVAYNLPNRDCSGRYSAGGTAGERHYRVWIDDYQRGIGDRLAIVILEPDGVPDSRCLSPSGRASRLRMLRYAVTRLSSGARTSVYIDAGRSDWRSVGDTVRLLRAAGVARARGFSLDVTGYARTGNELRYGRAIGRRLGGKHFVVSTTRNGLGPMPRRHVRKWEDLWCNQWGRALGPKPSTRTGDPLADAYFWILAAGNSDGECNGGGKAGEWWPEYALGLARRAAW